jgi:hypothetical protein
MFNNLEEQIESTQGARSTQAERFVRYLVVAVLSVIVFGDCFSECGFLNTDSSKTVVPSQG